MSQQMLTVWAIAPDLNPHFSYYLMRISYDSCNSSAWKIFQLLLWGEFVEEFVYQPLETAHLAIASWSSKSNTA